VREKENCEGCTKLNTPTERRRVLRRNLLTQYCMLKLVDDKIEVAISIPVTK
jgi:hypothetical protein